MSYKSTMIVLKYFTIGKFVSPKTGNDTWYLIRRHSPPRIYGLGYGTGGCSLRDVCRVLPRVHSVDGCALASTLCRHDLRKGYLFVRGYTRMRRVQSMLLPPIPSNYARHLSAYNGTTRRIPYRTTSLVRYRS